MRRFQYQLGSVARALMPLALALGLAHPAHAEDAFVSDRLAVPLYGAPSDQARVVERAVPGGSRITLLETAAAGDFARVRTETGLEGWLAAAAITTEPPARARLAAAEAEVERLSATIAELRTQVQRLGGGDTTANQRLTELNAQLRQEVESLALELQVVRDSGSRRSLLWGAGLILLGLFVGLMIKARPRRSAWS